MRLIRLLLSVLIVLNFVGLAVGALQLFNGAYPIGTVMFGSLFPQGIPNFDHSPLSFGDVDLMWHPVGAFQIVMFGLSQGLGFTVATLPMLIYAYHVTDVARSDPFTLTMVRKLRNLGLLILIGGLVSEVAAILAGRALLHAALATEPALRFGADLDPSRYLPLWWLVPGLLVLAFAEVVRHGCHLRAELEGVI
jgi:hypothetical protein